VSICLSKGLGAPVGSVLCGSVELIDRARRWRKVAGGGMRQSGILAAAGLHALAHHVERLRDDHDNAARLAAGLSGLGDFGCELLRCDTNMVFLRVADPLVEPLAGELARRGILIEAGTPLRLVTHLDIAAGDIERVVAAFRDILPAVQRALRAETVAS
jgi:threonine aldolase